MRKYIMPAVAIAALAYTATPAKARIILSSGYSPPYYGGFTPGGLTIGNGALLNSALGGGYQSYYGGFSPYSGFGNYGGFGSYNGFSNYSMPYGSYYRGAYSNRYGGRGFGRRWR
jgi:hypothetical protein